AGRPLAVLLERQVFGEQIREISERARGVRGHLAPVVGLSQEPQGALTGAPGEGGSTAQPLASLHGVGGARREERGIAAGDAANRLRQGRLAQQVESFTGVRPEGRLEPEQGGAVGVAAASGQSGEEGRERCAAARVRESSYVTKLGGELVSSPVGVGGAIRVPGELVQEADDLVEGGEI